MKKRITMEIIKVIVSLLALFLRSVNSEGLSFEYGKYGEVALWMNTVGPYHNPQETYNYMTLPYCTGGIDSKYSYRQTLGEALQGIKLVNSWIRLLFKGNRGKTTFCHLTLNKEKFKIFDYAVRNHYWYQMYIDDLPIWGIVGELDESNNKSYIWTHKKFEIGYNGNRIVEVNLSFEGKVELKPSMNIDYTYEMNWKPSPITYKDRFKKYLDPKFFQHKVHWYSIFNILIMAVFLMALVSMILFQIMRKDNNCYNQYEEVDAAENDFGDELSGWKQIHGDVFRPAAYPMIFSAIIGCGHHIILATLTVITLAIIGDAYKERDPLLGTSIFVYAITSPVNGYFGGALYSKMGGRKWIKQMLLSAFLLPLMAYSMAFLINLIAIFYHVSRVIPFSSMVEVVFICFFVILPLTLVGTLFGRNMPKQKDYPCLVNAVPRPIPEKKWFMEPLIITILGGILPFGSIFIEMYFIFTSFWAYKIYYVYGYMMFVVFILMVVIVCVTIVSTYFLLNAEDYRWQWMSFAAAASTAFYIYFYSFYYFMFKTNMYGLFQTVFYFGYMALFSIALGIMCGTIGYIGADIFVCKIYNRIKLSEEAQSNIFSCSGGVDTSQIPKQLEEHSSTAPPDITLNLKTETDISFIKNGVQNDLSELLENIKNLIKRKQSEIN